MTERAPRNGQAENAWNGSRRFVLSAGLAALLALAFVQFPHVDLWAANILYSGDGTFVLSGTASAFGVRTAFKLVFVASCIVIVAGFIGALGGYRLAPRLRFPAWLFLVSVLVMGPGFVANTVLKDSWGRARPHHVVEFGGTKSFTPAFERTDQCARNCSFIGGESSAIFALFFALAFVWRRQRNWLLATGGIAGLMIGIIRMMQGAHFLSDIVVSGICMMLVTVTFHWLIFVRFKSVFAEDGPVHQRLALRPAPRKIPEMEPARA